MATSPFAPGSSSFLSTISRSNSDILAAVEAIVLALSSTLTCILGGFIAARLAPNIGDAFERLRERWTIAGPTILLTAAWFFVQPTLEARLSSVFVKNESLSKWYPYVTFANALVLDLGVGVTYTIVEICLCAALLEDSSNAVVADAVNVLASRHTAFRSLGLALGVTGLIWFGNRLSEIAQVVAFTVFHLSGPWIIVTAAVLFRVPTFVMVKLTVVSYYLDARLRQGHDIIAAFATQADLSPSE